ncbi:YdeI/OmpD-associated family protein [Povalibacter sp.]|uniref:YdeI/OmpD-associated family protein n=1 Tax=Povalibacter sp. TaxID=1962978 RepID=UPI002F3FFBE3
MPAEPTYFEDTKALRKWFTGNAASARVLHAGFMKTSSGTPSITWPEAVDEALCVGWIDGVRHRIDAERYTVRFTPRKPGSHWSAINIRRATELEAAGRMKPAGLAAFARRTEARSMTASYEQTTVPEFSPTEIRLFKKRSAAWTFYEALPPGYRKKLIWWVVSAQQAATRSNRLSQFIEACAQGKRL